MIELPKEPRAEALASLQRFFAETLEQPLSAMHTGFLLDYILQEIAPLAYNRGVEDAQKQLQQALEDLTGTCFEQPFTHWTSKPKSSRSRSGS
jgi:uncharacterized protein (DUF2164 family)